MPAITFQPGFLQKVRDLLQKVTKMDVDMWLHSVRVLDRSELRALIPGKTCLAIIGLSPEPEKVLLEIDLQFAYHVVDKLLGGHGPRADVHRPLTEVEKGVFSFAFLKVMMLFRSEVTHINTTALRLEDMRNDIRGSVDILRHEEHWACVAWKMNFDLDVGYIRALIPLSLVHKLPDRGPHKDSPMGRRLREHVRQRLYRIRGIRTEAHIEIGRTQLSREDLEALDPGDIILLDATALTVNEDSVEGPAHMSIGLGRHGRVNGTVQTRNETPHRHLVFEVSEIEIHTTPAEHDPKMIHGQPKNPEQAMAEYEDPERVEYGSEQDEAEDVHDEDWGTDDENEGEEEEYEEEYAEEGEEYEHDETSEEDHGDSAGAGADEHQEEDNLIEAEPLLGDIPIALVVELGRVQLTADEIIRLEPGQVIELGRAPTDPVDLVVGDKLLAKGELVEIEGALGVKILSLAKESSE